MNPTLLNIDDLMKWTGYKNPDDVENFLIENRIPYLHGVDHRPITTLETLNKMLMPDASPEKQHMPGDGSNHAVEKINAQETPSWKGEVGLAKIVTSACQKTHNVLKIFNKAVFSQLKI